MLRCLKLPSALIISLFCSATLVQADELLLDGVRPFICDGEAVVLLEADGGWAITSEPDYKVSELRDGWQIGDQGMGFIAYLKEYEEDEWTLEVLSDDGYEEVSCIDLAEGVSEVVTAIKPRLDEAIVETQEALAEVTRSLRIAEQNNERLLEDQKHELSQIREAHKNQLIKLRQEKLRLEAALENAAQSLEVLEVVYGGLRKLVVTNEVTASEVLSYLQAMPSSERIKNIEKSSLGRAAFQTGPVASCVGLLRDKGALNSFCRGELVDYLVVAGW